MLTTTLIVGANITHQAVSLIAAGCLMSIGFWIGKKITNKADEILTQYDKRAMKEYAEDLGGALATQPA